VRLASIRGKDRGVLEFQAGRDFEAAGSADHDEALHTGLLQSGGEGLHGIDDFVGVGERRSEGADGRVGPGGSFRDARRRQSIAGFNSGIRCSQFRRVPDDGGNLMTAREKFGEDAASDHTGRAVEYYFHVLISYV